MTSKCCSSKAIRTGLSYGRVWPIRNRRTVKCTRGPACRSWHRRIETEASLVWSSATCSCGGSATRRPVIPLCSITYRWIRCTTAHSVMCIIRYTLCLSTDTRSAIATKIITNAIWNRLKKRSLPSMNCSGLTISRATTAQTLNTVPTRATGQTLSAKSVKVSLIMTRFDETTNKIFFCFCFRDLSVCEIKSFIFKNL